MNNNSTDDAIERLAALLREVNIRAGKIFTGVGVIVAEHPDKLPIFPLRSTSIINNMGTTAAVLAKISEPMGEYHDGFHVLTPNLKIVLLAQYFSPPIDYAANVDHSQRFGGRYLAALFGSVIPGVVSTGISTRDFGVAVFQRGKECFHSRD